ncbi:PREDICTED: kinesin-like protein KIF23 [Ceratosolen solmsi marchali]|uniref:Kinesin-like protein n=1 Tax=Ceratosolen solmsi marchali TaxID=326594 RepID=A0AAJ7E2Q1_9HYME|nr:PREDICTED: kinesin-like protein KIF23 [Ceratosolen solmsi marchali]
MALRDVDVDWASKLIGRQLEIRKRKQAPPSARKLLRAKNNMLSKDPVQVYCRLRPMQFANDISCMKIIQDTTIAITPPESAMNFRNGAQKEIQTTFTHVFAENISQREIFQIVSLPLVENLIHGRNGLLFTYGVTGSGKTYTMTGDPNDSGIMPRCLDVIFNSISNYQAKKFVFKPDKLNGFDVQSETDAMIDRQNELHAGLMTPRNTKTPRSRKVDSDSDSNPIICREIDDSRTVAVDHDYVYAVFVTYVEIYNNIVYDLLEEEEVRTKILQSKIVREDGNKNMYVHAVTEVEVKSSNEAFEIFQKGQRRRRVAHTALNAESSRSHSVFTIRLIQAPLDSEGEQIMQDKRSIIVSQLSLVDLAGSERTNRTKNTGQRLREAGNINNSLMTLRSCLEILRENQMQGTSKMVPYRDSKLTHLFKNYFDGEGQVRMIVCVNPRTDDYDETIQVMKFAEMTQEVQIARSTVAKLDFGLTPGRRQANKIFKEVRSRLEKEGHPEAANLEIDIGLVYSLGGPFPDLEITSPHNDQIIINLMNFLEQRINKRNLLRADLEQKQNDFRKMLLTVEQENINLKVENATLKASSTQQKKKVSALEGHLCKTEAQIDSLLRKLNTANDTIRSLQQELKDRDMALNQRIIDKQRVKQKYTSKIQHETDKMNRELEIKLKAQREHLQNQMKEKDDKIRLVKQILVNENGTIPILKDSTDEEHQQQISSKTPGKTEIRSRIDKLGVANPRYRRSQSADRWVDHRPEVLVPVGTILQPLMRRRRSVTKLTSPKEIIDGASRYCLTAQNEDTDGELETKLYKADILPTRGGGAQVVFNDVECLKQLSPTGQRKRSCPPIEKDNHVSADYLNHCANQEIGTVISKRPRK